MKTVVIASIFLFLLCVKIKFNLIESRSVPSSSLDAIQANNSSTKVNQSYGRRFLVKLVSHIFEILNLKQVVNDIKESKSSPSTCYPCKFGMALVQQLIEFGKSQEELSKMALTICTTLHLEKRRVCKGIINLNKVSCFCYVCSPLWLNCFSNLLNFLNLFNLNN